MFEKGSDHLKEVTLITNIKLVMKFYIFKSKSKNVEVEQSSSAKNQMNIVSCRRFDLGGVLWQKNGRFYTEIFLVFPGIFPFSAS